MLTLVMFLHQRWMASPLLVISKCFTYHTYHFQMNVLAARTEEHSQSDSDDSSSTNTGIIILVTVLFTLHKLCTEVAFSRRSKILPARKHVSSVSGEYMYSSQQQPKCLHNHVYWTLRKL